MPAAFPPLRSPGNRELPNRPSAQVSSFIGRDAALAEVRGPLSGSRLVTLTGPGGAGKTRLGLRVTAGLVDVPRDGVWFVDLAPLQDPALVAVTVADALSVRQEPGRPVLDTLVEALNGQDLLVLLDNCEHVADACAKLADALLRGCLSVALLATSREPLGIDGERIYRVPPMDIPADDDDVEAIRASEAVRLFEDRAAAQGVPLAWDERGTEIAGRTCRLLDGIPLAIELAAAEAIAAQEDVPAAEVVMHLGALVDKSLVKFGDNGSGSDRYRLLETVRQYAAGQLDAIAFSLTQPDPRPGLRLAVALRVYWRDRGHAGEAIEMVRAILDGTGTQEGSLLRARALGAAVNLLEAPGGTRSLRTTAGKRWPLPAPPAMKS